MQKMLLIGVGLGVLLTLGGTLYSAIEGRYLEAVAISSLGPVLAWFALGRGRSEDQDRTDQDDDDQGGDNQSGGG